MQPDVYSRFYLLPMTARGLVYQLLLIEISAGNSGNHRAVNEQ